MRVDDQTKVTNAIAAAIEYITKGSVSSLASMVKPTLVSELRGAIAIVSTAARREIETLPTPALEAVASCALDTLRLRRGEEFASRRDAKVVIARELSHNHPRISTETYDETSPTPTPNRQGVARWFLINPVDMMPIGGPYQDLDEALTAARGDAESLTSDDGESRLKDHEVDEPPYSYWVAELDGVATYLARGNNAAPEMIYASMR